MEQFAEYVPEPMGWVGSVLGAHRERAAVDRSFGVSETLLGDRERLARLARDVRLALVHGAGEEDAGRRDREHHHRCEGDDERNPVLLPDEPLHEPAHHEQAAEFAVVSAALRSVTCSVAEVPFPATAVAFTVRAIWRRG